MRQSLWARWGSAALMCCLPGLAHAHIKWFNTHINLMIPPRGIGEVLSHTDFMPMLVITACVLFAGTVLDHVLTRQTTVATLTERTEAFCARHTYAFLRTLLGVYFLVLGWENQVILTPESASTASWVAGLQIVTGLAALWPRTGVVAGIGILLLYGMCVEKLGLFHMLDYPAFIGAAVYLIKTSLKPERHHRALLILRVATAASLMVGAAEKFGYPNWSFQMLHDNPILTFGVSDLEFYMVSAGMVEFALAYLILVGDLSGKAAALIMFTLMASAIALFGWMDAVGHAVFLAALLALALNRNPLAGRLRVRGRHGELATAWLHLLLFAAMVFSAVNLYRVANIQLVTLCATTPNGIHLHR